MAIKFKQNGQAVLESLFTGSLIAAALNFTFYLIVFFWMKLWSSYTLYESLICRESRKSSRFCEMNFRKKFKQGQFLFKVKKIVWKKTLTHQSAKLTVEDIFGIQHTSSKRVTVSMGKL
jgi:hypothetical protein